MTEQRTMPEATVKLVKLVLTALLVGIKAIVAVSFLGTLSGD